MYAVLDESLCVQYIGISRHIGDSLRSHVRELPQTAIFTQVCSNADVPNSVHDVLYGRFEMREGSEKLDLSHFLNGQVFLG